LPIPRPAPVTTATLFSNIGFTRLLLPVSRPVCQPVFTKTSFVLPRR